MIGKQISRRKLIESLCGWTGSIGLANLLSTEAKAAPQGHYSGPQLPPKAKHVIVLFMQGGPSQIDMFDPKPTLLKYQGQRPSEVNLRTERSTGGLFPSPFEYRKYGRSGIEMSSLLPHLATVADDLCVVKSMYTFNPTHTPGVNLFHCGTILATRPSMGAWVSYGLGSENENIPSFIVLGGGGAAAAQSGFLPSEFQGAPFNGGANRPDDVIPNLRNHWLTADEQRRLLDEVQTQNRDFGEAVGADPFLDGRIQSLESAFRMQSEAYDLVNLSQEPESIRAEYGDSTFGKCCLMARRLVEKGVRYVHVNFANWDDHIEIDEKLVQRCPDMDQAAAALIRDLKRRGKLAETLVVWGGEFGRTPVSESGTGRDHNPYGFTVFLAGGGVKGGLSYGATDEFGFKAVENRVSIHDLHATILNRLGIDHTRLTYRYAGRDFRLTDVFGDVVNDILI